jgi:hypothetical protein
MMAAAALADIDPDTRYGIVATKLLPSVGSYGSLASIWTAVAKLL